MVEKKTDFYKPKNSNINIEDIEYNHWYAITINPQKQYYNKGYLRYSDVMQEITKLLNQYIGEIEYFMYMEVSKLGRLHFHGYIKYKKDLDLVYMTLIPDLVDKYSFEIDYINDPDIWAEYISKQTECFKFKNIIQYPPNLEFDKIQEGPFGALEEQENSEENE